MDWIFFSRPRNDDPQSDGQVASDAPHSDAPQSDLPPGDDHQGEGQQNDEPRQNGSRNYRPRQNRRRYYRPRRGPPPQDGEDGHDRNSPQGGERNGIDNEEPRDQDHENEDRKVGGRPKL